MFGVVIALCSALCWGSADYVGGLQSRRAPQVGVMAVAQLVGLAALVVLVATSAGARPSNHHLLLGLLGGLATTAGLAAFYRALAVGTMSVAAPITATGAALPVIVGIAGGETPGVVRLLGIAAAVVGVILVSRQQEEHGRASAGRASVVLALLGAIGLGLGLILMRDAAADGALWGVLAQRVAGTALMGFAVVVVALRGGPVAPGQALLPSLVALGLLDAAANTLYAISSRHGLLSVTSVVASLYPVVTVLLARVFLGERVRRIQELGIASALIGIVLIAAQ